MAEHEPTRVYGEADHDADKAPPQGMRGEGATPDAPSDLKHAETLPDGSRIEIEETSGVAYAEIVDGAGKPD